MNHLAFIPFCRNSFDAAKVPRWNEVVKMLTADKTLSTMAVRRFLQETGCPKCYIENAEYLEKFDPHGIYPTTIYGRCSGEVLAKPDASVVAITSRYTLTTTAKIVYDVLNPTNPELRAVYQPIGRFVSHFLIRSLIYVHNLLWKGSLNWKQILSLAFNSSSKLIFRRVSWGERSSFSVNFCQAVVWSDVW